MKKLRFLSAFLLISMLTACTGSSPEAKTQTMVMAATPETQTGEIRTLAETEVVLTEPAETGDRTLNEEEAMQIRVQGNGHTVVFELNDSPAARSLYNQLPLNIEVENYSNNEKIFYPPERLEVGDTPLTGGGEEGGLAYFASWGDVIMYYGNFGPYGGLYDLGNAISGSEWIESLSGEIVIETVKTSS